MRRQRIRLDLRPIPDLSGSPAKPLIQVKNAQNLKDSKILLLRRDKSQKYYSSNDPQKLHRSLTLNKTMKLRSSPDVSKNNSQIEKLTDRAVSEYYKKLQEIIKRKKALLENQQSNKIYQGPYKNSGTTYITSRQTLHFSSVNIKSVSNPLNTGKMLNSLDNPPNPFHKFFNNPRIDDIVLFDSGHLILNRDSKMLRAFFEQLAHIYVKKSAGTLSLDTLKMHLDSVFF